MAWLPFCPEQKSGSWSTLLSRSLSLIMPYMYQPSSTTLCLSYEILSSNIETGCHSIYTLKLWIKVRMQGRQRLSKLGGGKPRCVCGGLPSLTWSSQVFILHRCPWYLLILPSYLPITTVSLQYTCAISSKYKQTKYVKITYLSVEFLRFIREFPRFCPNFSTSNML